MDKADIDYDECYGSLQYYGILEDNYVDIERFNRKLGINKEDFAYVKSLANADGMLYANGKEPKYRNFILHELEQHRDMWLHEYYPMLKSIKTPKDVEDETRLAQLCYTCDMDDYDDICTASKIAAAQREKVYQDILRTVYLQYFCATIAHCEQLLYKLICDCGYQDNDFTWKNYKEFLIEKKIKYNKLDSAKEFDGMRKIYNFLKHGTKSTFDKVKKSKYAKKFLLKDYNKYDLPVSYINNNDSLLNDAFEYGKAYLSSVCEKLTGENAYSKYLTIKYYVKRAQDDLLDY